MWVGTLCSRRQKAGAKSYLLTLSRYSVLEFKHSVPQLPHLSHCYENSSSVTPPSAGGIPTFEDFGWPPATSSREDDASLSWKNVDIGVQENEQGQAAVNECCRQWTFRKQITMGTALWWTDEGKGAGGVPLLLGVRGIASGEIL
jgi:hypothetical protein